MLIEKVPGTMPRPTGETDPDALEEDAIEPPPVPWWMTLPGVAEVLPSSSLLVAGQITAFTNLYVPVKSAQA